MSKSSQKINHPQIQSLSPQQPQFLQQERSNPKKIYWSNQPDGQQQTKNTLQNNRSLSPYNIQQQQNSQLQLKNIPSPPGNICYKLNHVNNNVVPVSGSYPADKAKQLQQQQSNHARSVSQKEQSYFNNNNTSIIDHRRGGQDQLKQQQNIIVQQQPNQAIHLINKQQQLKLNNSLSVPNRPYQDYKFIQNLNQIHQQNNNSQKSSIVLVNNHISPLKQSVGSIQILRTSLSPEKPLINLKSSVKQNLRSSSPVFNQQAKYFPVLQSRISLSGSPSKITKTQRGLSLSQVQDLTSSRNIKDDDGQEDKIQQQQDQYQNNQFISPRSPIIKKPGQIQTLVSPTTFLRQQNIMVNTVQSVILSQRENQNIKFVNSPQYTVHQSLVQSPSPTKTTLQQPITVIQQSPLLQKSNSPVKVQIQTQKPVIRQQIVVSSSPEKSPQKIVTVNKPVIEHKIIQKCYLDNNTKIYNNQGLAHHPKVITYNQKNPSSGAHNQQQKHLQLPQKDLNLINNIISPVTTKLVNNPIQQKNNNNSGKPPVYISSQFNTPKKLPAKSPYEKLNAEQIYSSAARKYSENSSNQNNQDYIQEISIQKPNLRYRSQQNSPESSGSNSISQNYYVNLKQQQPQFNNSQMNASNSTRDRYTLSTNDKHSRKPSDNITMISSFNNNNQFGDEPNKPPSNKFVQQMQDNKQCDDKGQLLLFPNRKVQQKTTVSQQKYVAPQQVQPQQNHIQQQQQQCKTIPEQQSKEVISTSIISNNTVKSNNYQVKSLKNQSQTEQKYPQQYIDEKIKHSHNNRPQFDQNSQQKQQPFQLYTSSTQGHSYTVQQNGKDFVQNISRENYNSNDLQKKNIPQFPYSSQGNQQQIQAKHIKRSNNNNYNGQDTNNNVHQKTSSNIIQSHIVKNPKQLKQQQLKEEQEQEDESNIMELIDHQLQDHYKEKNNKKGQEENKNNKNVLTLPAKNKDNLFNQSFISNRSYKSNNSNQQFQDQMFTTGGNANYDYQQDQNSSVKISSGQNSPTKQQKNRSKNNSQQSPSKKSSSRNNYHVNPQYKQVENNNFPSSYSKNYMPKKPYSHQPSPNVTPPKIYINSTNVNNTQNTLTPPTANNNKKQGEKNNTKRSQQFTEQNSSYYHTPPKSNRSYQDEQQNNNQNQMSNQQLKDNYHYNVSPSQKNNNIPPNINQNSSGYQTNTNEYQALSIMYQQHLNQSIHSLQNEMKKSQQKLDQSMHRSFADNNNSTVRQSQNTLHSNYSQQQSPVKNPQAYYQKNYNNNQDDSCSPSKNTPSTCLKNQQNSNQQSPLFDYSDYQQKNSGKAQQQQQHRKYQKQQQQKKCYSQPSKNKKIPNFYNVRDLSVLKEAIHYLENDESKHKLTKNMMLKV